jgi:hypothetical protein
MYTLEEGEPSVFEKEGAGKRRLLFGIVCRLGWIV